MAHCAYSDLQDLKDCLSEIRGWENVKEPKPGIFYFKRLPFLHFHHKDGERWADVRDGKTWGDPVPIPFGATPAQKKKFLVESRKRHVRMIESAS